MGHPKQLLHYARMARALTKSAIWQGIPDAKCRNRAWLGIEGLYRTVSW